MTARLISIGTDAEFFLRNKETHEIISAENYVKGSKHRPFRFDKDNKWYTTQLDNVLAEITIPPAEKLAQFLGSIDKAITYLTSTLPDDIEPVIQASANLDEKYLMTEQAQQFGCDPDFNAYTGNINQKPFCEDLTLRSCGAHVHVGYEKPEVKFRRDIYNYEVDPQRASIVQIMDLFLSVPLVIMEPDSARKLLYGKAGAFRPKPYGLEYRTPSSWYLSSKETTKWIFNATHKAFEFFAQKGALSLDLAKQVEDVINNNNKSGAKDLIKDFNLQLA